MKKLSLAVKTVGQMILLRENASTPTDNDWDGFLEILIKNRDNFENLKCLVVTDGGGPNAAQIFYEYWPGSNPALLRLALRPTSLRSVIGCAISTLMTITI